MPSQQLIGRQAVLYRLGWGLILASLVFWASPLIVSFFPASIAMKTRLVIAGLVIAEILFWVGAVLAGRSAAMKIKRYFNPRNWRKSAGSGFKK